MIKKYCCEDISLIENFDIAVNSLEKWECHHRLETYTSDGERRLVDISKTELIALDMYYNRPASELIFLSHGQHRILHHKDKKVSEETCKKISEVKKGKKISEETRKKISEVMKGRKGNPKSEEWRRKLSESMKGKHKGKHWKLGPDGKRVWY